MVFNMCFPKVGGGNALARSTSGERKRNQEIDKLIRRDKKANARQVKILLLGKSPTLLFLSLRRSFSMRTQI